MIFSFHMTLHREWFYEYEMYNGNVFLVYDLPKKITRHGRVKLFLNDGRVKTLLGVANACVQIVLRKDRCKMV